MEPNDEFQDVGKKLPYMAPDNFFEKAAMKTLQEAKIRERRSRQIIYLWRSVAVAASLTALAILGFFMFQRNETTDIQVVAQENNPTEQTVADKVEEQKSVEISVVEEVAQKNMTEKKQTENIDEVLADLTEEELLQMAAMIKADPFAGEYEQ